MNHGGLSLISSHWPINNSVPIPDFILVKYTKSPHIAVFFRTMQIRKVQKTTTSIIGNWYLIVVKAIGDFSKFNRLDSSRSGAIGWISRFAYRTAVDSVSLKEIQRLNFDNKRLFGIGGVVDPKCPPGSSFDGKSTATTVQKFDGIQPTVFDGSLLPSRACMLSDTVWVVESLAYKFSLPACVPLGSLWMLTFLSSIAFCLTCWVRFIHWTASSVVWGGKFPKNRI